MSCSLLSPVNVGVGSRNRTCVANSPEHLKQSRLLSFSRSANYNNDSIAGARTYRHAAARTHRSAPIISTARAVVAAARAGSSAGSGVCGTIVHRRRSRIGRIACSESGSGGGVALECGFPLRQLFYVRGRGSKSGCRRPPPPGHNFLRGLDCLAEVTSLHVWSTFLPSCNKEEPPQYEQ